jgi:hypothetical protein
LGALYKHLLSLDSFSQRMLQVMSCFHVAFRITG